MRQVKRTHGIFAMIGGCAVLAAAHASAAPVARIVEPIDESHRVELPGLVNRKVRDSQDLGRADPAGRAERIILVLSASAEQNADLEQFLRNVQSPGRPEYHRWLTPADFEQRFGVAAADRRAVRGWLEAKGFRIEEEPKGGRSLVFSGTLGQVNQAFATEFRRYRWHGERHLAVASNPSIPQALSPAIAGFASLSDFPRIPYHLRGSNKPQFTNGSGIHFLAPGDFATIYDVNSLYARGLSGKGASIAVLGRSDVLSQDLSNFRSTFGLTATLPQIIVNGPDPGLVANDELESDLDLEWAGAVAPSAAVIFVTSQSTSTTDGVDLSSQYAVSNNLSDVISISYGSCESASDISGGTTFYNQLWQQAAAQGTSVFTASGDSGAAGCDAPSSTTATHGLGVNLVCSSPYSTCVGGSELDGDMSNPATYWSSSNAPGSLSSALGYIGEAVWNQSGSTLYASGGGASIYFAKPAWQLTTGVPSDGKRDVPDVALSASADHDPYLAYTSDGEPSSTLIGVGGTSVAAPAMAGLAALVAQQQGRVGNFNPVLYGLAQLQFAGGAPVFHLITSGNNSVPGQTGFSATTADPTYSQAAGLGSLDAAQLLAHWRDYVPATYGLLPTRAVVPSGAFVGSATLTLPASSAWSATVSGGTWLTVQPSSGTGSAPLTFFASSNSGSTSRTATITIVGQVLTVIQAPGTGHSGQISLSTATIGFGTAVIGEPTPGQPVLVSNTGSASLTLTFVGVVGSAAGDYSESGNCVAGLNLAAGASCFLTVAFDPTAVGNRVAALQILVSGGSSASTTLSGSGITVDRDADGPLPLWSYCVLALLLSGMALRKHPRYGA